MKVLRIINNWFVRRARTNIFLLLGCCIFLWIADRKVQKQTQIPIQFASPVFISDVDFSLFQSDIYQTNVRTIKEKNMYAWYRWFYYVDFFFALFLIGTIYALTMAFSSQNKMKPLLIIILIVAYVFDLSENFLYLGIFQETLLPQLTRITSTKTVFYTLGFAWLILSFGSQIKQLWQRT